MFNRNAGFTKVFVAAALAFLVVGHAQADFGKCSEAKSQKSEAVGQKASSGKWNASNSAAVDSQYLQQLIGAHQQYRIGSVPPLVKDF